MHTKENWFFFSASWCRHWPRNQWNTVAELQKSQKKHVVVCDKFYLYFLSGEIACRETGYRRTLAPNSLVFIESTWYPPPTLVDPPFVFFRFYLAMLCIRGTSRGPVSVRVCVCPSVTSRCFIETAEWIELVFGMWVSFQPSYTMLKGNSFITKNMGTSLWNFVLNSWLRKFRHGISIVETCYQLSSRKVDAHSVINWVVVGQLNR